MIEERRTGEISATAVICHPHSVYGGSLDNKVVYRLARSFLELGAVSIRFNFRGVGDSQGGFDHGEGELEDLAAVVHWARGRWPERPLWLAGFSFGGAVVLKGARRLSPDWLVTVAPAIRYLASDATPAPGVRWLVIQGTEDDVVPTVRLRAWLQGLQVSPRLVLIEGAGHFFHGHLNDLRQAVLGAAQSRGA
ncbi:MAG: alpha/beta hydrolase [Gammaproteobacteria bacterium]